MPPNRQSPAARAGRLGLPRNVWVVTFTSFLTDVSSEMVLNLVPLFLANVLGVRTGLIGLIEGLAEMTAGLLKVFSGWLSDRLGPRRTLTGVLAMVGILTVLLGRAEGAWLLVLVFLQPSLAACFYSPAFAAIGFLSRTENRHMVVSLVMAAAIVLGGGALPAGIGLLGQMGHFGWGITGVGVLVLCGLFAVPFLRFSSGSEENKES
jgi:NNP family nitrate/nitrite transporter-like MFS transporter